MFGQAVKTGKRAGCTLARMEDVAVRQPRSGARIPLCGILFHMIGKFSELLYHTKALRGMRTSRLRKMSADADALRRGNSTLWNSFSFYLVIFFQYHQQASNFKNLWKSIFCKFIHESNHTDNNRVTCSF